MPPQGAETLFADTAKALTAVPAPRRAALRQLLANMIRPKFVQAHHWRAGDLVLSNNRTLIHTATEYDRERHRRLVWRTSVRGEIPLASGEILAATSASH